MERMSRPDEVSVASLDGVGKNGRLRNLTICQRR